jgi:hypothetical protein
VFHLNTFFERAHKFHELEELGSTPAPKCPSCMGCRDCQFRTKRLLKIDQEILAKVEEDMVVDQETGCITASYPWKTCVRRLSSTRQQAAKVQGNMEKRMRKDGSIEAVRKEIQKALDEEKVREFSEEEMSAWQGPEHYITVFQVF